MRPRPSRQAIFAAASLKAGKRIADGSIGSRAGGVGRQPDQDGFRHSGDTRGLLRGQIQRDALAAVAGLDQQAELERQTWATVCRSGTACSKEETK